MAVISSKHLKTATELTLVANVRPEFVWTRSNELMSYGTRLVLMLKTFFELRRAATEQSSIVSVGPLERLRSLYNFTWSTFDGGSKLLLSVTFDRPWEPYIRAIVDQAGPLLDAIFCHCTDYEGHSTEDGYVAFASWVRERQIDASLFYVADPDLTVDDQRYLKEFERRYGESSVAPSFAERAARLAIGDPGEGLGAPPELAAGGAAGAALAAFTRVQRSVGAVVSLRPYFHVPAPELLALASEDPQKARVDLEREARFYDRAGWLLLEPALPKSGEHGLPPEVARALRAMRDHAQPQKAASAGPAAPATLGKNVQGNVLTSYEKMTHGAIVLIGFDGGAAARQFLANTWRKVTRDEEASHAAVGVNVALTYSGLRTLGSSELELENFPREFQEGMRERAGLLGDVADEHPVNWSEPQRMGIDGVPSGEVLALSSVDLLLMVQVRVGAQASGCDASSDDPAWGPSHPAWQRVTELVGAAPGAHVLHVQTLHRQFVQGDLFVQERFGFADGISQPVPSCRPDAKRCAEDRVELGELLLGYPNDRGEAYPPGAHGARSESSYAEQLCRDGSFLVVRKLQQDVDAFEQFVLENANQFTGGRGGAEELYAKLMGRYKDGAPLVAKYDARSGAAAKPVAPEAKLNAFDYARDPAGEICPLVAHARRTNPRTPVSESVHGAPVRLPRLLRRGFSYGPLAGEASRAPRGLMFMAYNASLAEQFEVIQRWINGGNSTGVSSSHADPIVSHASPRVIRVLDAGEPRHLLKKQPFVKLKWGLYLFAPSISALEALAQRSPESRASAAALELERQAKQGRAIIAKLQALELLERNRPKAFATQVAGVPSAKFGWKLALEDRFAKDSARAVWAAIRKEHGGALRTTYGVLVASSAAVREVLSNEAVFSVREYWQRMRDCVGPLYLGMDRCPVQHPAPREKDTEYERAVGPGAYAAASKLPNAFIYGIERRGALALARHEAALVFERLERGSGGAPGAIVSLREFAVRVVSALSRRWFGLPLDDAQFELFQTAALAIFFPEPEACVRASGKLNRALVERTSETAASGGSELQKKLAEQGFTGALPAALIGGTQGFLAATVGSFLSVAHQWLEAERLPRLRGWLSSAAGQKWLGAQSSTATGESPRGDAAPVAAAPPSLLELELLAALARLPVPDLLHRTVVRDVVLGGVTLHPSDTVVVSVASALAETPEQSDLLFGGAYSSAKEPGSFIHACPGKEAALGAMLGMFVELLGKDLRREGLLRVSQRRSTPV